MGYPGSGSMEPLESFPGIVHLNVGGCFFTASLQTLRSGDDGSMLSAMFSGRVPVQRDAEGRFFIDRDGSHFRHILNYLRDGSFPVRVGVVERLELEREVRFYGLSSFSDYLRGWDTRADNINASPTNPSPPSAQAGSGSSLPRTDGSSSAGLTQENHPDRLPWVVTAEEVSEGVLNSVLEEWGPGFAKYLRDILVRVGDPRGALSATAASGDSLDAVALLDMQSDILTKTSVELAYRDLASGAWRWSDRKTGVNHVLRAKLLKCRLERLGYRCRVEAILDKNKEPHSYCLQVELPTAI